MKMIILPKCVLSEHPEYLQCELMGENRFNLR